MQKRVAALLAVCLGAGLAGALAQKPRDSTIVDPDVHQVVLENDRIRVLEARAAPGWKSPLHAHPPLLLVSIGSARVKLKTPEGQPQIVDLRPGTVLWNDKPLEHSWELLAGELHVVAVEVKTAQAARGN